MKQFETFEQDSLKGGKYRWHLRINGDIIYGSTEGYHNKQDRDRSLEIARTTSYETHVVDLTTNSIVKVESSIGILSNHTPVNKLFSGGISPGLMNSVIDQPSNDQPNNRLGMLARGLMDYKGK